MSLLGYAVDFCVLSDMFVANLVILPMVPQRNFVSPFWWRRKSRILMNQRLKSENLVLNTSSNKKYKVGAPLAKEGPGLQSIGEVTVTLLTDPVRMG